MKNIIKQIYNSFISNFNGNNFSATDFISEVQNYYSSLSFVELTATLNILGCCIILMCLFTIIIVLLSDILFNKLNITSANYPRIYKFIVLRKNLQSYYLILDFTIIIAIVFYLILCKINTHFFRKLIWFFLFQYFKFYMKIMFVFMLDIAVKLESSSKI